MPPKPKALTPATRGSGPPWTHGRGFGVEEKRAGLEIRLAIGFLDKKGRQHFMVQRQRGVDQPSQTGGALSMTDHRLNGADNAGSRRRACFAQNSTDRSNFSLIADHGSGAVCFDKLDPRRRDVGLLVGALQSAKLPFRPRCR